MGYANILVFLLLLYPLCIQCHDRANEELKSMVQDLTNIVKSQTLLIKELTETVSSQGERLEEQHENIRDLRKSLDKRMRENDLKIEWALTDGTLAPKNTSGIIENLARQEKILNDVYSYTYKPGSCAEIDCGDASGVYRIYPNHECKPVKAWCDNTADGGWTVIQRRFNGNVDFYRGWAEYAEGFGDPAGEYWLGLRHIHALTKAQPMELYVGLTDFELGPIYAKYSSFSVSSEEDKFRLHIGTYSGNASDSLRVHNGQRFSTKDQDNDAWSGHHCSRMNHGAWWYIYCDDSNLNGLFTEVKIIDAKYMTWFYLHSDDTAMKASVMMIRPANFRP